MSRIRIDLGFVYASKAPVVDLGSRGREQKKAASQKLIDVRGLFSAGDETKKNSS